MNKTAMAVLLAGGAFATPKALLAQTAAPTPDAQHSAVAAASEVEALRQQLAAQSAINQQLRQHLAQLEQQLASRRSDNSPLVVGLDANAAGPPAELASDIADTALEQALVTKGVVLLPVGSYRVTPSFTWAHDGGGNDRRESYFYGLSLEAGLPWGMAASVSAPYVQRDYPAGSKRGLGDVTVSLSKKLTNESAHVPSLVVRLDYTHDNGKDAFTAVPIGDGLRKLDLSLSAVKLVEPLALYGTLSYGHAWPKTTGYFSGGTWWTGRIEPADRYGLGLGVSLAATPEISLDAGLNLDFRGETRIDPVAGAPYHAPSTKTGYATLGANFVLRRNLSLSLSASAGVSQDADDFLLGIALPYRF